MFYPIDLNTYEAYGRIYYGYYLKFQPLGQVHFE